MNKCLVVTLLLLCPLLVPLTEAGCKIMVKVRSQTKNKFQLQIFIPSIQAKSERVTFTEPEEKKIEVAGENCAEKKWVFRTWKPDGAGDWIGAKQDEARVDGNGWVRLVVDDELRPRFMDRLGVACGESQWLCG